jgi:hypothetical protein
LATLLTLSGFFATDLEAVAGVFTGAGVFAADFLGVAAPDFTGCLTGDLEGVGVDLPLTTTLLFAAD